MKPPEVKREVIMFVVISKKKLVGAGLAAFLLLSLSPVLKNLFSTAYVDARLTEEELFRSLEKIIILRNRAVMTGDLQLLASLYNRTTTFGTWAYEHQAARRKYLAAWAEKQGVRFVDIHSTIRVNRSKPIPSGFSVNFLASTTYKYVYVDEPLTVNSFRVGSYHSADLVCQEETWLIGREWYTDPFAGSLPPETSEKNKDYILSRRARDFTNLNPRRRAAVEYADQYAGAAAAPDSGFPYNRAYKNYNYLGGDCTNYASQVLHEGGGFPKTYTWNYQREGSRAWVNAEAFTNFMLYSGRASLLARGSYNEVLRASYELLPGDFIAYEKKGEIAHISIVTGADSRGYTLVNSHNVDRYRVPWDLGWNDRQTRFWLVRVHY